MPEGDLQPSASPQQHSRAGQASAQPRELWELSSGEKTAFSTFFTMTTRFKFANRELQKASSVTFSDRMCCSEENVAYNHFLLSKGCWSWPMDGPIRDGRPEAMSPPSPSASSHPQRICSSSQISPHLHQKWWNKCPAQRLHSPFPLAKAKCRQQLFLQQFRVLPHAMSMKKHL